MTRGYQDLVSRLGEAQATLHPSEVHGAVCGVACAPDRDLRADLGAALAALQEGAPAADPMLVESLMELIEPLREQLRASDFRFQLALPEDEVTVDENVLALGAWCRGFLLGLVAAGVRDFSTLSADSEEMLQDMVAIAEVQPDDEDPEEQERHLMELEEYLRVAVQTVFDELHAAPPPVH